METLFPRQGNWLRRGARAFEALYEKNRYGGVIMGVASIIGTKNTY